MLPESSTLNCATQKKKKHCSAVPALSNIRDTVLSYTLHFSGTTQKKMQSDRNIY